MPVKRRRHKFRMTPAEECSHWVDYFDVGSFLLAGEREALGVPEDADIHAAARVAWQRLGRDYLDHGIGLHDRNDRSGRGAWALEAFGPPPRPKRRVG